MLSFDVFFPSFSLAESSPRDLQITANKYVSLLLQIIFCPCVIETTLFCENGGSVFRADREWFNIFSWSKERWSNDKTIIELGYRKVSWFVRVSQINYLPQSSASANKGWFSYNRRYRFDRPGLRPIARIEHARSKRSRSPQSRQALTIVYVMFTYDRPNRKTTFWIDSGDRNDSGDYMRTSLNWPARHWKSRYFAQPRSIIVNYWKARNCS